MKFGAVKAKAEWLTNQGVIPGEECRSLESPVR
jgi:hypothetical protein